MFVHLALAGTMQGALGLGLDVVHTAAALTSASLRSSPPAPRALAQRVVSLDGGPVRDHTGRTVAVDGRLDVGRLGTGDVLVVPGVETRTPDDVASLLRRVDVQAAVSALRRAHTRGVHLAASCAATFVLAESGALDGLAATTTHWLVPAFATRFPRVRLVPERMVVPAGSCTTAGAAFAHADLALALVARAVGPRLARRVASLLVLDERPSQARYMVLEHPRTTDPTVLAAEAFVTRHLADPLDLPTLARAVGTSPRTFSRRVHAALGTTPARFVQRLRMAHAERLLQSTGRTVDDIAGAVGYADASAFRRVYRSIYGSSPRGR